MNVLERKKQKLVVSEFHSFTDFCSMYVEEFTFLIKDPNEAYYLQHVKDPN